MSSREIPECLWVLSSGVPFELGSLSSGVALGARSRRRRELSRRKTPGRRLTLLVCSDFVCNDISSKVRSRRKLLECRETLLVLEDLENHERLEFPDFVGESITFVLAVLCDLLRMEGSGISITRPSISIIL